MKYNEFIMNNVKYKIVEVEQQDFWEHEQNEQVGYYYGQSHFMTQEVWLEKSLSKDKKKKVLYHELMHCYIREYLTGQDITNGEEEIICDLCANSHDLIHEIVERYFKG